jgi:carbon-monoxide dehydrogenase medium subunit
MIPDRFDYVAPESLEDALGALAQGGEDAKVLAGGHSLIPLMRIRMAAPSLLVDLRRIPGLAGIRRENGAFRIGAMTTHHSLAAQSEVGLPSVAATIADQQVRNRGTLGGTLAHGDPASDLPPVVLALDGVMTIRGQHGTREVPAARFFHDYLTTAVGPGEIVTEIRLPALEGYRHSYQKINRRQEDWPMVAVSVLVRTTVDGACEDVRIGLTNMGPVPLRATPVEEALRGQPFTPDRIAAAAELAAEGTNPPSDFSADSEYRRHLARVLCRRALTEVAGA